MTAPCHQRTGEPTLFFPQLLGDGLFSVEAVIDKYAIDFIAVHSAGQQAGDGGERVACQSRPEAQRTADESGLQRQARGQRAKRDIDSGAHRLPQKMR